MKSAVTVIPETGRISPMYDAAQHLLIVDCYRRAGVRVQTIKLPTDRAQRLGIFRENGIELLITGAITNDDAADLTRNGIRVCSFASGDWREVWQEWRQSERLASSHLMPGCHIRHRRCGRPCGRLAGDEPEE